MMKINLQFEPELQKIFELLEYKARLVGGCVRDYILYGKLVYDIDIATPYLPQQIIELLEHNFSVIPTGLKHGTVTVIGKHKYEITTLRKDEKTYGRHADVSFNATYQEDAARRDFTINALYADYDGVIYDYFDGLDDLKHNVVKFIGSSELRIKEDYLRILRFFRFSMRFDSLNNQGYEACLKLKDGLLQISRERITQEWFNIINGKYFFKYLDKFKPIMEILQFDLSGKCENLNKLSLLGLNAFFFSNMLMFSNVQKQYINNLRKLKLKDQTDATLLYNKYGEMFIQDKMFLENRYFDLIKLPKLPIDGNDLLQLGYTGPKIGEILNKLQYYWAKMCGKLTKEELLEYLNGK